YPPRTAPIEAQTVRGFVRLKDKVQRYYEYYSPKENKQTLVFINGLIWPLSRWTDMIEELKNRGYGILIYDMRGQSKTLLQEQKEFFQPLFAYTGLSIQSESDELIQLMDAIGLKEKVVLVPLSYGAAAGTRFYQQHPDRISELIFLAPLIRSLDNYDPEGGKLNQQLNQMRAQLGPVAGPVYYEMAYNSAMHAFLEKRITPEKIPAEMKPIQYVYKESLYQLIRAVRDFYLLKEFPFEGGPKVSLFLAEQENPAMLIEQKEFFQKLNPKVKGIQVLVKNVKHAIPDERGTFVAQAIDLMLNKDERLVNGATYELTSGGEILPKDTIADTESHQ
ncbi:MAG TPA: alpha/beta hydrolase, partial [Pseudobdellovibrionaceae bacterium]|nr:alpha/beta hydrolase [Pseudobdellovibrionaceae bacterium]